MIARDTLTRGRFIGFAAEPGRTAETGPGEVSVFTQALLAALSEPGPTSRCCSARSAPGWSRPTAGRQSPRYVDDLTEELVLNTGGR